MKRWPVSTQKLTALLWPLWPPPDSEDCCVQSEEGHQLKISSQGSPLADTSRECTLRAWAAKCWVSSVLSSARKVELKPQPCRPSWLRPDTAVVTRKASLPWIDAAKTDMEGKRRVLLSIRYKYIDIYLYRDLIVQSCMPYGHSMWSECGPPAPTRSWP